MKRTSIKRLTAALVLAGASLATVAPGNAGAAPEIKNGDTCTKALYGKSRGSFRCTYNAKSKKYTWSAVKRVVTTTTVPGQIDKTGWPSKFIIGAVPSENAAAMTLKYQGLVKLFQDELGIPVEFYSATDYAGIIEAQIANRVDLAFYGPFSYVIAKNKGAKIEPAGVAVSSATGTPGYKSYGIAKSTNSAVNSISDFKGKKICFVDPASTSGALYPTAGLLSVGIDPKSEAVTYAGTHDASVLAVKNGTCDVGFAYDDMVDKTLIASGKITAGEIKTVWKSGLIAGSPIAVRVNMPKTLVAAVKDIVLNKANKTAMVKSGRCASESTCQIIEDSSWGFLKTTDSYYDGVRQVCESTKSSKCK